MEKQKKRHSIASANSQIFNFKNVTVCETGLSATTATTFQFPLMHSCVQHGKHHVYTIAGVEQTPLCVYFILFLFYFTLTDKNFMHHHHLPTTSNRVILQKGFA